MGKKFIFFDPITRIMKKLGLHFGNCLGFGYNIATPMTNTKNNITTKLKETKGNSSHQFSV